MRTDFTSHPRQRFLVEDQTAIKKLQLHLATPPGYHVTNARVSCVGPELCEVRLVCHDETVHDRADIVLLQRAELGRENFAAEQSSFEGDVAGGLCVVRVPYGVDSAKDDPSGGVLFEGDGDAGSGDVDDEGVSRVARIRCRFCGHPLTSAEQSLVVRAMPSGRWDDCIEDMICFDGPSAVPMLAREVNYANAGRCLMGHAEVLLHSRDVIPGAVALVDGLSPPPAECKHREDTLLNRVGGDGEEWRSVECARCELPLGRPAALADGRNSGEGTGFLLLKHCLFGDELSTADDTRNTEGDGALGMGSICDGAVTVVSSAATRPSCHVFTNRTAIKWLMGEMEYSKQADGCARFIVTARGRSRVAPGGCLSLLLVGMRSRVSVDGSRKPRRAHRIAFREQSQDEAERADEAEGQEVPDSKSEAGATGLGDLLNRRARVPARVLEMSYGEYCAVRRRLLDAAWASSTVDARLAKCDSRGYRYSYLF